MKVRELIEKLQEMDPEAEVWVNNTMCCDNYSEASLVWPSAEPVRDHSKKYSDPDAYRTVSTVKIS